MPLMDGLPADPEEMDEVGEIILLAGAPDLHEGQSFRGSRGGFP